MATAYRIVLYLCAGAFAALVAQRWLRRDGPRLSRARRVNEAIWTLIPALLLLFLMLR
ncbi:MAG: hypothetical protein ACRD2H_13725 [Terriglobales bacterium]